MFHAEWERFNRKVSSLLARIATSEEEAEIAVDIVLSRMEREVQEVLYGSAFPGVYDHHGCPNAYDVYEEHVEFKTDEALALAKDKDMLKKLIHERVQKA